MKNYFPETVFNYIFNIGKTIVLCLSEIIYTNFTLFILVYVEDPQTKYVTPIYVSYLQIYNT